MRGECLVKSHQFPTLAFTTVAAASNLPNSHDGISVVGHAHSVDLDDPGIAVVSKFETFA
jgi:hypothetical protein